MTKKVFLAGCPYRVNKYSPHSALAGCKYSPHPVIFALFMIVGIAACAVITHAQGSRKDDVVFNAQGRPMAGAAVRICTSAATGQPCAPLAQVYSDAALTQALANPLSADGLGNYSFYASPGRYMIEISGPGITTKQIPNVILPSDPSSPTFTSVTTTSGISAFSLSLTGNLTVNGSTAVVGSLTVGGVPVPSTNADNQWTAVQRFKGPIPYRDVTAYMPAGGCSSTNTTVPTGSITTGTTTLTLSSAIDFKDGCGIAVLHAGPTATISTPPSNLTISSVSGASNTVTIVTTGNHNLIVGSGNGQAQGVQVTSCSDSAYNGTFPIQTIADTTHLTYTKAGVSGSPSSCAATVFFGYAHGVTGATSYVYKVAAIDFNQGFSAASSTYTITTGNASLTRYNYNWLGWPYVSTAAMYGVYRSTDGGSTWTYAGTAFTNAYIDMGLNGPTPPTMSATVPPASAGADVLNTTIVSGGGTTSLVLAANASTTATTQSTYHDESSFLNSCIIDTNADEYNGLWIGAYGCLVPAGHYFINGNLRTSDTAPNATTQISVAGTIALQTTPIFINSRYSFLGIGSGGPTGTGSLQGYSYILPGANLPALFVIGGSSIKIDGFSSQYLRGYGIWAGQTAYNTAVGGLTITHNQMQFNSGSTGTGTEIFFANNVIFADIGWNTLTANPGIDGPPTIWWSQLQYNGTNSAVFSVHDNQLNGVPIRIDGPGGNGTGGGLGQFTFTNNKTENQSAATLGWLVHDNGPNASGATSAITPINTIAIRDIDSADAIGGAGIHSVFEEIGSSISINNVTLENLDSFGTELLCSNGSIACNELPQIAGYFEANVNLGNRKGVGGTGVGINSGGGAPLLDVRGRLSLGYNGIQGSPLPALTQELPAITQLQTISTGSSGSLAANTYCYTVSGKDAQPTPGITFAVLPVCATVGASGNINTQWTQAASGSLNQAYAGFRFWFCSTGGSSCTPNQYLDLGSSGNPVSYNFTSTAGATGGTLPSSNTAYLSWLAWRRGDKSCLLCTASAAAANTWPLGVGDPAPPSLAKFSVANGAINSADTGYSVKGALLIADAAPTISSGFGTSPSVTVNNGTAAFRINVGTGGTATSGVIGLPAATTGWNCYGTDITTNSASVFLTKQTASTTTTATIGNFNTSAAATAWAASDILAVSCFAF